MAEIKKFLFFILLISFCIPFANASCLDIRIAKSSYLSGETFQAEITGELTKPLSYNSISFSNNEKEYFPSFYVVQMASNKYLVFGDLPEKQGLNVFSVNRIVCRENETLREESKNISFLIKKPLQNYFAFVIDSVKGKWGSYSSDEISRALILLENISDSSLINEGKTELLKKGNGKCWPSSLCSIKSTSLALLALGNDAPSAAKNWLLDAQNSVDIGLWNLVINSTSAKKCNMSISGIKSEITIQKGMNSISLNMSSAEFTDISADCNENAKITHTFMGNIYGFTLGKISNEKCWGNGYKNDCDAISTAYALQVLQDSKAQSWLSANSHTTEEIALADLFEKTSSLESWLANNQHSAGYWSSESLVLSDLPDVFSTVAALKALNENPKAEGWLRDNLDSFEFEELLYSLQIFVPKIEPIVSFQQGLIKASSLENITLTFSNKGIFPVNLSASIGSSLKSTTVPARQSLSFAIEIPAVSSFTLSSIDIKYNFITERGYSIPIMIFPNEKAKKETNILIQSIENQTLKLSSFQFVESQINNTINFGDEINIQLNLKNLASENVTVDFTIWNLTDVVKSIPVSAELKANEIRQINLTLSPVYAVDYSGQITAESGAYSSSIPVYVKVISQISNKSCSEFNGEVCKTGYNCNGKFTQTSEGKCCLVPCEKEKTAKSSSKTIGIALIVFAVLIVALIIFLKTRKPKKSAIKDVLEKIKKESALPAEKT